MRSNCDLNQSSRRRGSHIVRREISKICIRKRYELGRQELGVALRFGGGWTWVHKFHFESQSSEMPVSYV